MRSFNSIHTSLSSVCSTVVNSLRPAFACFYWMVLFSHSIEIERTMSEKLRFLVGMVERSVKIFEIATHSHETPLSHPPLLVAVCRSNSLIEYFIEYLTKWPWIINCHSTASLFRDLDGNLSAYRIHTSGIHFLEKYSPHVSSERMYSYFSLDNNYWLQLL